MKSIYMLAGAGALSMLLSGCAPGDSMAGTPTWLAGWRPAAVTTLPPAIDAGMQPLCMSA